MLSWRTRIPSFKIHLHLFLYITFIKNTELHLLTTYWSKSSVLYSSNEFLIISPLNGSPKQSLWQNYIPYVLNILITVRCFNGLLILFSVFSLWWKKKSMSYFVKKLYVYIYFQQRIPSTYKDKKSRQSYLMTCIFSLIINHRQARMALNIENSSLWVGKWKVKAIRKGRRHFSSRKNHFLAAKSVISHQTASAVLLSHLHGTITESVTRKIQTEIVKAILNNH